MWVVMLIFALVTSFGFFGYYAYQATQVGKNQDK